MVLDLACLALLAVAAVHGAVTGAVRQILQVVAVALGWIAARHLAVPVAAGLGRSLPPLAARGAAAALLFLGVASLVSLVGAFALRASGFARPGASASDRGAGALLGGAKGAAALWILLSAVAIAGNAVPASLDARHSDLLALARRHNLLERVAAEPTRALERLRGEPARPAPRGRR